VALSVALLVLLASPAASDPSAMRTEYSHAVRQLDGEEFLEDEPIWLCAASLAQAPASLLHPHDFRLVGVDASGGPLRRGFSAPVSEAVASEGVPRGFEFGESFGFRDAGGRFPLVGGGMNGIPPGRWQVVDGAGDTTKVLARFVVIRPGGSERSVRDGLARAARLAAALPDGGKRAATLYEAIYRRYPRTAYLSVLYWGEWQVRGHTRFATDPSRWLEEIFAHFHDSCFGVIALDQWVRDMGEEAARPTVRRLVGLYPDTPLSRAAQRYL
jgi:hypothetical protein